MKKCVFLRENHLPLRKLPTYFPGCFILSISFRGPLPPHIFRLVHLPFLQLLHPPAWPQVINDERVPGHLWPVPAAHSIENGECDLSPLRTPAAGFREQKKCVISGRCSEKDLFFPPLKSGRWRIFSVNQEFEK